MALRILRDITANLQSTKYCIMIDETSDISTQEQVVVVMRWVDGNLDVHEDFLGLHTTHSIDANTLVAIIHDVLLRLNLKLENCRGQCYDGASNMQGARKGVATQILKEEPKPSILIVMGTP